MHFTFDMLFFFSHRSHSFCVVNSLHQQTIPSKILTSDRALCLGYDIKDITNVLGLDCDDLGSQHTQEWQYDLGTLRIQNTYDNKCLDYNLGTGNVELFPCHDGMNQKWEYDGIVLKSKVEGTYGAQCIYIDTIAPHNAFVYNCPSSPNSNTEFFIVGKVSCISFFKSCIQHFFSSKNQLTNDYFSRNSRTRVHVQLEPFEACSFDHDCLSNECGLKDANSMDLMCCSDETSVSLPFINKDNVFCGNLPADLDFKNKEFLLKNQRHTVFPS